MITAAHRLFQVGGFSPLSLNPALWLSDTGSSAGQWDDLSGNGRHATQSSSGNQPAIITNALNGRQVRRFDGVNDFLSYSTSLFTYTGAASVFAVTSNITTESGGYGSVLSEHSSSSNSIGCQTNRFPNSEFRPCTDVYAPGGIEHGANYTASTPHIICWSWSNWSTHKTNGNTVVSVDGKLGTPTAYGSNPAGFTSTNRSIGRFDGTASNANYINADIAEIIVFPRALTTPERQAVERYLSNKYAITI